MGGGEGEGEREGRGAGAKGGGGERGGRGGGSVGMRGGCLSTSDKGGRPTSRHSCARTRARVCLSACDEYSLHRRLQQHLGARSLFVILHHIIHHDTTRYCKYI